MFISTEILYEIGATIRKNKLRTFLTGFAVAWGIFMLIVLLAAGNGIRNGVMSGFEGMSRNSITIYPGSTSIPYQGLPLNRDLKFYRDDIRILKKAFPQIETCAPCTYISGQLSYKERFYDYQLMGTTYEFFTSRNIKLLDGKGRLLNELDEQLFRKVILLSTRQKEVLFPDSEAIGKTVLFNKIPFTVIGIYQTDNYDYNAPAYVPFSIANIFSKNKNEIGQIAMTVSGIDNKEANEAFIQQLKNTMGKIHRFNPQDQRALWIWNNSQDYFMTSKVFAGISLFLWIVGLSSLIAGIVGISNIMLITVKERTREFGIRKALGATPSSIIALVVWESLIITLSFGYIGLLMGIGVTEAASTLFSAASASSEGPTFFKNPTIDLGIAISATLVMVLAGVLAGLMPARRTTKITPIEAMRSE